MDLTTLTDDELDALRIDVLKEQERRERVEQLPDQLATLARDAAEAGCDPDALRARVDEALTEEDPAEEVPTVLQPAAAKHFDYLTEEN